MNGAIIEDRIFELYPEFYRAIVVVQDASNLSNAPSVDEMLQNATKDRMGFQVEQNPVIRAWDEAHRKFGSNPNKYPPSVKALLKRVAAGRAIPFINCAVALFNFISLKYLVPCGGDDVMTIVGDLVLGIAVGSEAFTPLGEKNSESPEPGEVIYFDGATKQVMCRRWNWRNSEHTKIQTATRTMLINVDCLPPTEIAVADAARDELASLFERHCKARVRVSSLHKNRRQMSLSI